MNGGLWEVQHVTDMTQVSFSLTSNPRLIVLLLVFHAFIREGISSS